MESGSGRDDVMPFIEELLADETSPGLASKIYSEK